MKSVLLYILPVLPGVFCSGIEVVKPSTSTTSTTTSASPKCTNFVLTGADYPGALPYYYQSGNFLASGTNRKNATVFHLNRKTHVVSVKSSPSDFLFTLGMAFNPVDIGHGGGGVTAYPLSCKFAHRGPELTCTQDGTDNNAFYHCPNTTGNAVVFTTEALVNNSPPFKADCVPLHLIGKQVNGSC